MNKALIGHNREAHSTKDLNTHQRIATGSKINMQGRRKTIITTAIRISTIAAQRMTTMMTCGNSSLLFPYSHSINDGVQGVIIPGWLEGSA